MKEIYVETNEESLFKGQEFTPIGEDFFSLIKLREFHLKKLTLLFTEQDIETIKKLSTHYEGIYAHGGMNRDQTEEVANIVKTLKIILTLIRKATP